MTKTQDSKIKKVFKKIGRSFKKASFKEVFFALGYLPKVLTRFEKILILVMILVIIGSIASLWREHWLKTTQEVPKFGGTYIEGIVGEPKDLEKNINRLTKAGLTKLDPNYNVIPDLAESWEVLENGKTYKFHLRQGFLAADLAGKIVNENIWPDINISTPDDQTLVFSFNQSFSPFLSSTSEAIFPYGPYKILKEEKNKITFTATDTYWQGKPNIDKIIFIFYSSKEDLLKAAQKGEIMGALLDSKEGWKTDQTNVFEMALPRQTDLFFNLTKNDLKNVDLRRNLRDGKPLNANLNLTLVTSDIPQNIQLAENVKSKWESLGAKITIEKVNNVILQKDIIPQRNFDLLLYGLDYGADPDPYPFWHSSQIKADGMNLSSFSNKDADKLLEQARQTADAAVRADKYAQFYKILDDQVPYIIIEKETCYYFISKDIKGITQIYGASEADRFLNVNTWYIKSKRVKK